jgi:hypothetical protein
MIAAHQLFFTRNTRNKRFYNVIPVLYVQTGSLDII